MQWPQLFTTQNTQDNTSNTIDIVQGTMLITV